MSRWPTRAARWTSRYLLLPLIVVLSAASLIPLAETNIWWVRYLDFPRLESLLLLLGCLGLYGAIGRGRHRVGFVAWVLAIAACSYNAYRMYPYMALPWQASAPVACAPASRLRVMIANVQESNRQSAQLLNLVQRTDPDVFLAMETSPWWNDQLAPLDGLFAHQIERAPADAKYYGIHLYSKYPLVDSGVRFFFGASTPTVDTGIRLPGRDQPIRFIGLHPRPPQSWSQPSTVRDGHIIKAGLIARDSSRPTIVAGDFNAVSWERVTRRAMRIGHLLDPRHHRGVFPSYDAKHWYLAWPLDQILYQAPLQVIAIKRLPAFGSDHYPMMADFCVAPSSTAHEQAPPTKPGDMREARQALGAARRYVEHNRE